MKRVIICLCLMSAIVIFSLWGIFQINSLQKEFDKLILKSEDLVLQQDLKTAQRYLDDFSRSWEALEKRISYVSVNTDLKEISELVSQLEFQLYSSPENYFENCIKLRSKILALMEAEIPDFEGVF